MACAKKTGPGGKGRGRDGDRVIGKVGGLVDDVRIESTAAVDEEIERVRRFGGKLSLIFIDLDFFKKINDTRGHMVGSRTLSEIGRLIRANIRKICKAARYGGDEFVVILPNTGKSGAMTLATKLRELFREHEFRDEDGTPFNLTASFGLATYPDDARSKDELIRLADQAMYRVKETTRDAVQSA